MKHLLLISVFIGHFFLLNAQNAQKPWQLKHDADGIQVFTRKFENTDLTEFKAVTIVEAKISSLVSVINDPNDAVELFASINSIKNLKVINDREWISHAILDTPFPFDNRDMIVHTKLTKDPVSKKVYLYLEGQPKFIPQIDDLIRIPFVKGFWEFEQLPAGKVKVTYQNVSDPGGMIPHWLLAMVTVHAPYQTLLNLKKLSAKPAHRQKYLAFVEE